MKANILTFLSLTCILCLSTACSDDDDKLKVYRMTDELKPVKSYIKSCDMAVGAYTIYMEGGKGRYSVISEDTTIVLVGSINEKQSSAHLLGKKVGNTSIIIQDEKGNMIILPAKVSASKHKVVVTNHITQVELADNTLKERIEKDLIEGFPVSVDGGFYFTFQKSYQEGDLIVYPKEFEKDGLSGKFLFHEVYPKGSVSLLYNGLTLEYDLRYDGYYPEEIQHVVGFVRYYLVEDFTSAYQSLYPQAGITKVERAMGILME